MNPMLERAVQMIAGRCDGAVTEDGIGFNGRDASFGKSLASQPESEWSPKQRSFAHKMMRTYRVQLLSMGLNYDQIPVPDDLDEIYRQKDAAQAVAAAQPKQLILSGADAELWFPYDPKVIARVKGITGRRYRPKPKPHWTVPLSEVSALALIGLGFDMSKADEAHLRELVHNNHEAAGLADAMDVDFEIRPGLGGTLRPYQLVFVAYVALKRKVLCGDQMGLGKTMESLGALHHLQAYPALIVVPAGVKPYWLRRAREWLPPTVKIGALAGTKLTTKNARVLDTCDVVIVNYDVLGWKRTKEEKKQRKPGTPTKLTPYLLEREWAAVIADEVHFAKNYDAQLSRALGALARKVPIVAGLTGTPVLNRPQELVNILGVIDRLNDMGGFWPFLSSCGVHKGAWGGLVHTGTPEQLEVVNQRLMDTCMIRRKKEEVLLDLPPKVRTTVPLTIDNRKEYSRAANDLIAWLRGTEGQEAADKAKRAEHLVRIEKLKMLACQGKFQGVVDWVTNFLESGEKLVLFAHHKVILAQLLQTFPDAGRIVAEDDVYARDRQVQEFKLADGPQLMVASLKAGGTGIDGLQEAASDVAFVEQGWTPGEMDQAEDRLHRDGQPGSVTCWYLVAEETIEEDVAELIDGKRVVVAALTDGDASQGVQGSIMKDLMKRLVADQVEGV